MKKYYLAVDIGASSGRHILGTLENGKLEWKEIYRFANGMYTDQGHAYWNIEDLFENVVLGMQAAHALGIVPVSMAIDTWAVDYVLLDAQGNKLADPYAYRDAKNEKGVQKVHEILPFEDLYQYNGIQFQPFNTLYQIHADDLIGQAHGLQLIPDYLAYRLTGKKMYEYTNWSTTAMLSEEGTIHPQIANTLDLPVHLVGDISMPGTLAGTLKEDVAQKAGFSTRVVLAASHDTASAFMASVKPGAILSSGTWSLLGTERSHLDTSLAAREANFTSEGGYEKRFRFLKNIMGLWLIQEVVRNFDNRYTFADLVELARESDFSYTFDVNDPRFLKPDNMVAAIGQWFKERNLPIPEKPGDIARSIYLSLAKSVAVCVQEMEEICQETFDSINIIGGGTKNALLNEMIAQASGKTVYAGPVEATAIGNLVCQMIADHALENLEQARQVIAQSETIAVYH